ncbi:MAG: hypothetical protein EXQ70_09065 [Solirubrobacterales bacterium]|nr:hypothetical protein [Solirubrobacterales bacterium]
MSGESFNGAAGPPTTEELGEVAVVDAQLGPELAIIDRGGSARAIIWPGMGAELRSMHTISLGVQGRTIRLTHPSEAVYYVISGSGAVCIDPNAPKEALVEGSMVHIDPGTAYALCASSDGMELVGGPAPADPALYESLGEGE